MTALAQNRITTNLGDQPLQFEKPVIAADIIYKGAMVGLNAAGNCGPCGVAGIGAAIGSAMFQYDNSAGVAGDLNARLQSGVFSYANSATDAIAETDLPAVVYVEDDQTVALTNGGGLSVAGVATTMNGTQVLVYVAPWIPQVVAAGGSAADAISGPAHFVRGASTADIANLAAFTVAAVDGLTYVAGERILLKNQAAPAENGIYVVGTVAGGTAPLTRATDADGEDEITAGMIVVVSEGTASLDDVFILTTNEDITVDTTALTFRRQLNPTTLLSTANGEGAALVGIEDAAGAYDAANVEAAFAELAAITAGNGANIIGYEDAGTFTTAADVDAALDELYQDSLTSTAHFDVPCGYNWFETDDTTLLPFSGGASNTPGVALDNAKGPGIRWNNAANPDPICTGVPVPTDLDESQDVVVSVICWKSGATLGDATTFDIGVFNNSVGALHDADADYGGTSAAITGDAAAKTVQASALTLAAANLPDADAAPTMLGVTIQPTDGTLGTDDITLGFLRFTYTRKLYTS